MTREWQWRNEGCGTGFQPVGPGRRRGRFGAHFPTALMRTLSLGYQGLEAPATALALLLAVAALPAEELVVSEPRPAVELGERGVANFLAKVEGGDEVHVAFLGGSITQNAKGHSRMVADWLEARYPETEFVFTNAGLASTCSVTGAFRYAEDMAAKGPVDLLVVEFAVNDDQDAGWGRRTAVRGLEGILRQFFRDNPEGDVISVQYVNPEILATVQAGEEAVSVAAHKAVARHYGLPIVDVGAALAEEIAAGRMTWERDYGETHPNQTGYRFASGLIASVIERSDAVEEVRARELPEPLDPGHYGNARAVDPQEFNWLGGWKFAPVNRELLPEGAIRKDYEKFKALRSDGPGNMLYYSFAGRMLGAFVLAGPDAGMLEVSVDGGGWREVDLFHRYSEKLNYPRSVILADDLAPGGHQVAIRTSEKKNPESRGRSATVLFFEVN